MKTLIAALVAILLMAAPVSAQTPEQQEYERAVQIVTDYKQDLSEGIQTYATDPFFKPVLEAALDEALSEMIGLTVYDCYAEWYALQFSSLLIVSAFISSLESPEQLQESSNGYLQAAVDLTGAANVIAVDCIDIAG